jgi:hypothetical protein
MVLALWGPLATITKGTPLITLMVFATVNFGINRHQTTQLKP